MDDDRRLANGVPAAGLTDRRLVNPFTNLSHEKLLELAEAFVAKSGLTEYREHFRKGASLAQSRKLFDNDRYDDMELLPGERKALGWEYSTNRVDRFPQPVKLYPLVVCCSLGAAVQGW